jgi:uncharacterized protein YyaL (SSP411 family)
MREVRQNTEWVLAAVLGLCVLGSTGCTVDEGGAVIAAPADPPGEKTEAADKRPANRLAGETSPYLLLHAHNPVDWYPWGPDAFEKARREKKPIFLSIGYSSCYWCHVMERLVFQNAEIAAYMNRHFVNIKVDREERPDVDDIYMTALMVYFQLAGSQSGGGWPLSMFLTPEGKPFAGGTYFPPDNQPGRPGFPAVMKRVVAAWQSQQDDITKTADTITQEVRRVMKPRLALTPVKLDRPLVAAVTRSLLESHDAKHGGLDFNPEAPDAPKFPVPAKLALLQAEAARGSDAKTAEAVAHTLDHIAAGGIRDHLGGGFHRYSTDREWLVPHFEKMLYDQALMAGVYVEAFRQTGRAEYRRAAEETFAFVLRDMTDPQGGFYSALDAETEGVEGKYYVWSTEEIQRRLEEGNYRLFASVYGLDEPSTFEHGHILHLPQPGSQTAEKLKIASATDLQKRLEPMRQRLLEVRSQRPAPLRDDKILTSWNGLMICALADGGAVLGRKDYLDAAAKAATFVLFNMRDEQGRLHRTYRSKRAKLNAYLDDYAFLIEGLLALHRATGEEKWLNAARRLADDQIALFWDEQGKGFFFTPHHHEELIARTKNAYDAVLPAGNSVSARNLVRLAALLGEEKYRQYARETLELFAGAIEQSPRGMATMALALAEFLQQPVETVAAPEAVESPRSPGNPNPASAETTITPIAAEQPAAPGKKEEQLISAKAYLSVDKLPPGGTCQIALIVEIKEGWHINTNPAQPDFLIPTTFTLKSKLGTKLAQANYPAGRKITISGFDEPLVVYDQRAFIRGILQVPREAAGQLDEIELQLRYQACNDARCLSPKTFTIRTRLPIAAPGEPVKPMNPELFRKES